MINSNFLIHDCETGGLDAKKNPITQYACVVLEYKTLKEIDRFETFVKPYNDLVVEKQALEHTMVSMSDIRQGISGENLVEVLCQFYGQHQAKSRFKDAGRLVSVGHNIPFDHDFLEYAFVLYGKDFWEYIHKNFFDTMVAAKMAWGLKGNEKIRLTDATNYAKLKLTDAHGAMNDVEATADLFRWFVKKFRSKSGMGNNSDDEIRTTGKEFFEFKCGVKNKN